MLTHKLLAFSRRQVLQTSQFDFTVLLDSLLLLVRRVMGENITVTSETAAGLRPVLADPAQVEQSIVNLAINVRDAMPGGGTLQIAARNAPRPNGERRADGDVRPGPYVQITVTDTGVGMDDTTQARMFEPFFTTKPHGTGSGLGLSTVYGFIRQCGGYLGVTSAPGLGTSIELLLPRAPDMTPATTTSTPTPLRADGPKETVLVVEDDGASGDEALRVTDAFDGTIHVLLSDVVMPGMKGPELAVRADQGRAPGSRPAPFAGNAQGGIITRCGLEEI